LEEDKLKRQRASAQQIKNQMQEIARSMTGAVAKSIDLGFKLVEDSFSRAMATGVLNAQKALVDKLPKTQETIKLSTEIENRKIDLQIEEIRVTEQLIKEMELSRLSGERLAIERQRDEALNMPGLDPSIRARIETRAAERLKPITERETLLQSRNISEDMKSGKIPRTQESLIAMQRQLGTFSKVQGLEDQKRLNSLNSIVETKSLEFDQERKNLQLAKNNTEESLKLFKATDDYRNLTLEDQQAIENIYASSLDFLNQQLGTLETRRQISLSELVAVEAQNRGWQKIGEAANNAKSITEDILNTEQSTLQTTQQATALERTRNQEIARRNVAVERAAIQQEKDTELLKIKSDVELSFLDIRAQTVQQLLDQGRITQDQYTQEIRSLDLLRIEKERELRISEIRASFLAKTAPLLQQFITANETERQTIRERITALGEVTTAEINRVNAVTDAQRTLRTSQEDLSVRQKAYGDIFNRTFESMADALLEFVQTGKLNFRSLVNSMIQDLIRFELKQQSLMMYQAFRPTLMNLIPSIFGPKLGSINPSSGEYYGSLEFAKGGAFDSGVQKFAKGGMFTNNVVSEPTLFKFAKGAGMMGEAGPEAIMPLRRDSDGNLGVMAKPQGSNVEVVVNNFSGEKAEARETVDSRGNRKIEVIVGEMVAGELGRKNSPVQQSMMTNFMAKPAVVRR
jgi:phage-related minor tail protein